MSFDTTTKKTLDYALRILGRQGYSRKNLIYKLRLKGFQEDEIDFVIEKCEKYGYLNDSKLSISVAESLSKRGVGKIKIRAKLREKGFLEEDIEHAINLITDDSAIIEAFNKKASRLDLKCEKGRAKLMRFLLGRGFSYDSVLSLMKKPPAK